MVHSTDAFQRVLSCGVHANAGTATETIGFPRMSEDERSLASSDKKYDVLPFSRDSLGRIWRDMESSRKRGPFHR